MRKIKEEKLIKGHDDFEVYVDSPLAVEATQVFTKNIMECYDEEAMDLVKPGGYNPSASQALSFPSPARIPKTSTSDMTPKGDHLRGGHVRCRPYPPPLKT